MEADKDKADYLIAGFKTYGLNEKQASDWIDAHKEDLTPEFMAGVYGNPHRFFCRETGQDEEKTNPYFSRIRTGVAEAIESFSSGKKLEFDKLG
ncbi:MAG: hypothetical protein PHH54_00025 [Candidatus Nanoarchaeia archaeon]|nr:hypothetical protein [Candidatus Nanoarchaeia archaeon]MDD5740349.1 hypothetical protein [Candidatus Nanoarchaeia archaeon]